MRLMIEFQGEYLSLFSVSANPCLSKPATPGVDRHHFLVNLDWMGFEKAMKRYGRDSFQVKLRRQAGKIKKRLKRVSGKMAE